MSRGHLTPERFVNEFGMPPVPGGFDRTFYPRPPVPPTRPEGGSSRPFLYFLLILSCVALGFLLAWGVREHGERTRLTERNHEVEDAYVFVLAKRNDLATFLIDPRTHLYRLPGLSEASGRAVVVAWQE